MAQLNGLFGAFFFGLLIIAVSLVKKKQMPEGLFASLMVLACVSMVVLGSLWYWIVNNPHRQ